MLCRPESCSRSSYPIDPQNDLMVQRNFCLPISNITHKVLQPSSERMRAITIKFRVVKPSSRGSQAHSKGCYQSVMN